MSQVESNQERQDNEFQVLQAIFGSDLVDLRKTPAWNRWTPLAVRITLVPQQGNSGLKENHSQVDLHVECGEGYPNTVPEILLENSRGLSNDLIKILKDELIALSNLRRGEVVIFELCQHVQAFLHLHSCNPEYESFWDEMYGRREKQKQQILQAMKKKEDQEQQEMKDEIQRRKEILRSEPKIKKDQRRTSEGDAYVINPAVERTRSYSRKRCQSTSESSESSHCEHRGTKLFLFTNKGERQVYRGRCIGHSERGNTLYAGLDMTTGDVVTINEWQFKIKVHSPRDVKSINNPSGSQTNLLVNDISQCMKFIANMEHELNFLTKLRHRNLVNYLNIKYFHENDSVMVYILQEYISGISVSSIYLSDNFSMECDMLRYVAEEVLNALDFLHKNNVLHRDIRTSCVFIDKYGVIKLSDYSLDRRLYEFGTRVQNQQKNYSKKNDVYKFGLLLLSLIRGYSIDEHEKSPKIPVKLPFELRDFLNKCVAQDERNRWTTTQLLKHNFIRARAERCSPAKTLDTTSSGCSASDDDSNTNPDAPNDEDSCEMQTFIPVQNGGQSRIQNEFEILKWLGRGAFGDVLKVKNRLDGGIYAIKRIRLNPNNKQLNKKITREVKLLSRLNHENVVRYFNSWIESAVVDTSGSDKTSPETGDDEQQMDPPKKKTNNDLQGFVDDIEKLCPISCGVEWSISYESKSKHPPQNHTTPSVSSDDETTDDDDDDPWSCFGPSTTTGNTSDSSDGIEFAKENSEFDLEQSINTSSDSPTNSIKKTRNTSSITPEKGNKNNRELQFMYIQMEFCEKSTLRTAIDKGLNKDVDRVWRLFREIVDGLSHIHQQGMIHRDLKPVNIFLDSNDHVKIGDFGLATSNILPNSRFSGDDKNSQDINEGCAIEIQITSSAIGEGSLTGKVGTALYVAPELNTKASKAIYNQKVDIYSLGIILFEMAYAPLPTAMERVKVLANLRSKEIMFPSDFSESQYTRYVTVIRWLLNHNPSQRPTAQELLQSEHIPPPQIEESELQDLLRRTLANTQSKAYRYLIASCFDQDITPAEDLTYDIHNPKSNTTGGQSTEHRLTTKTLSLIESAKEVVIKIFKLHGGQCLTTSLLLPKSKYYDGIDSCVKMMTRSGCVVTVPHDLRVAFARYVTRNSISLFKRYSIERVYRERKVLGFQPRELYECAFDIITPTSGSLIAEAELLSIVYELVQEFPTLRTKNFAIRLNHTSLLRAVLLHSGIETEKHNDIYSLLADARDGKLSKFQVQTHLISLCLTDHAMMQVVSLMDLEIPLKNATTHFRNLLKRKGEIGILAKQGLSDLETIIQNTENLGVKYNIVIAPGLVYNINQYSGMMCQFVCELKKKRRKGGMDVLAAGGRYDAMLDNFRTILGRTGMISCEVHQAGAGISISLDKLVQALQEDQLDTGNSVDVLLCAIGTKPMIREKCAVLKDLWSAGIRCSLIDTNSLDEIEEQSRELNVTHSIILKENEQGSVLVRSWERDRFQERKVSTSDIVEFTQRLLKTWNDTNSSEISNNMLSRSESRTSSISSCNDLSPANVLPPTIVRFITTEKLAANTRRRYENQIMTQLSTKLQRLSSRCRVEILALNIESTVIRTMISYIDIENETNSNFQKMFSLIIEKHPRHKKYLAQICDYLHELKLEKNQQVIILYSLIESYYKMIL